MEKVFVFGIDGAMPEKIFGEWLDELPNIKKLLEQGCYARLNSTTPPLSGTAWTSMTTGKNPADHSIFEYLYRKNHSYEKMSLSSSRNNKQKTIWEIVSGCEKKSIVCFIPLTWPIKPFKGILISGILTPLNPDVEFVRPKELKEELNSFLGRPLLTDIPSFRNLSKKKIIEKIQEMTQIHLDSMKYLLQNKKWNLFFGVVSGSDRMNHSFWKYADKKHRKYDPNSEFKDALKDYYKFIDKGLGELVKLLEGDTRIIILSDHGITRMHNRVNLSDWLIKEGYLVLKEPIKEKTKLELNMIDWEKTKVFAIGAYEGQIYINLKEREPQGIVEPKDYGSLIEELGEKLKKIPGDDGSVLNTKIYTKEKYFQGEHSESAPDIMVYFDDLEYGANTSLIGNETLWSPQTAVGSDDAGHSNQGIFIMNNSERKGNIGEVDILDIAPTILDNLGIKIPEDFKGKVIE